MELKHINLAPISKLIGYNNSVLISLLEDLIKGSEKKYAELKLNAENKNWLLVKANAHFLKSNFRHLGHTSFTEILKKIEDKATSDTETEEVESMLVAFFSGFDTVMDEVKAYLVCLKKNNLLH